MPPVYTRMTVPTTMRALQQRSLDGPRGLRLTEVPTPRPGPGEVLIRVAAAGVNFVDVSRARGTFGDNPQPPFIAGFEAVGEVVAVGDGVELSGVVACAGPGAFAEYMIAPARAAMPIPPGWSAEGALGLVVNWPTALAALELGRLAAGETVLIEAAAGATGQAAIAIARRRGARVIAAASKPVIADHVIDSRQPFQHLVRELGGADVVLHSSGGEMFEDSLACAKRVTGRVVVIGLAGGNASITNWDLVYKHQLQLIGFNLGAVIQHAPQLFGKAMGELVGLIQQGVVTPAQPKRYALGDGALALADLESRATTGKLALIP